jgi:alkylhydroperoxidase/carboxymuconolactone decarboxylase family protein YurZ
MNKLKHYFFYFSILFNTMLSMHTALAQTQDKIEANLATVEKNIIQIASYTAQGELNKLKGTLQQGLDNGLTINETKEIMVHLYAYAGFPRSIRGLQTLLEVLKERKAIGTRDKLGAVVSPIEKFGKKYERGQAILEELLGKPLGEKPEYQKFSPEIDQFLKEHLFADVFEREILSYKQRELVTISVIASLGNLNPMLNSHYKLCLNTGWLPGQLHEFTEIIGNITSKAKGRDAKKTLKDLLKRLN